MIKIAIADPTDSAEIINLQRLAYQSEAGLYNDWSLPPLTQTIDNLIQEFSCSVILKAVSGNRIIGSVRARTEDGICKIGRLIVHPEYQRQGIGSRLLKYIEDMHENVKGFELFTGNKSSSNIELYEKHGYTISYSKALSDSVSIVFLTKFNSPTNTQINR